MAVNRSQADRHRLRSALDKLLNCRPLWRGALIVSLLAIAFLATTANPYPIPSAPSDKINHLIAFAELTLVTRLAWPGLGARWFVPGLLLFGLAIELVQGTLPYRDFSLVDLVADSAGILIGLLPLPGVRNARASDLRRSPESL